MSHNNPVITLNSGVRLPAVGFGVYRSKPDETVAAVKAALSSGYRMIDTAAAYFNETEVGQAIRESDVPRKDIVLQTKAWLTDYGSAEIRHAYERSRRKLGVEKIDIYLLHQPAARDFKPLIDAWRSLEKMVTGGEVGAIGVCNFSIDHLKRLMAESDVSPALNQVELHPYFTQKGLRKFHQEKGILTQAWSPIGGVMRYWGDDKTPRDNPLIDMVITEIAEKYRKTNAQVILRWQLAVGNSVIPKSVTPKRIRENFDLFDFDLTENEIARIEALDRNRRGGPDPDNLSDEFYNRKIPD